MAVTVRASWLNQIEICFSIAGSALIPYG